MCDRNEPLRLLLSAFLISSDGFFQEDKMMGAVSECFFFPTQNVDKWSFDVFALNEASGDHALKFIFYELLTRYDLISRFKVKSWR